MQNFNFAYKLGNQFQKSFRVNGGSKGGLQPVMTTQIFSCPPTHLASNNLLTIKTQITTSANYTDGIGTGNTCHDKKKYICTVKDFKNYFKINQGTDTAEKRMVKRG